MRPARLAALFGLSVMLLAVAVGMAATDGDDRVQAQQGEHIAFVPGLAANPAPQATATPTTSPPTATPTTAPPTATNTPGAGSFEVAFIDVGQGDATLITVNGERMLIDGGRSQSRIQERLTAMGIADIDIIVETHPDADHIAGLIRVLELYAVEEIYLSGGTSTSQTYADFMSAVNSEGASVSEASRGDTIMLGGLELDVFHPAALTGNSNEDSVVVGLTCGTVEVLFMGDATVESEASMLGAGLVSDIDVLKVGHHGSNTSTGQSFLNVAQPEYAVISAGMDSQYGHPHDEVVDRLTAIGATLYHTDTTEGDDTVVMSSDCSSVSFDTVPYDPDVTPPTSTPVPPTATATSVPGATATPTPATACVNINTASHEDLQQIINVGPARATQIIDLRPFASVDDLIDVSGIGAVTLQEIKDQGLACV